jgi:type II secretory pathway component GspD/PulD (secretin)
VIRQQNYNPSNRKQTNMKMKKMLAVLLATYLLPAAAFSQTNAAAADQTAVATQPAATADTNAAVATPPPTVAAADTNAAVAMASTNAVAAAQPAAVADTNAPVAVTPTNAVAAVQPAAVADTNAAPASDTNVVATAAPTIPLIQFQDVPLTTAIEALARQANINYLLDPKIGFGQPDANGQIKAEPNLSIRWENVPAQHALEALLSNYGLQLSEDTKTKIYRITTKDPAALPILETRVIQLKYASTTNMMDSISGALTDKRSRVIPDNRTSQLIVVATDPEQAAVDTLVSELDTPTKQVLIETRLVEISSNPTSTKGIDWSGTLAAQNISFGNNLQTGLAQIAPGVSPQTGIPTFGGLQSGTISPLTPVVGSTASRGFFGSQGFLNADGAHAVLSFLNASADAQVMSTPRVVTLDNETATISVQRTYPILQTTAGTQGSPGGSSISYSNVGTVLLVTPRISANNTIRLKVSPSVATFFGYATLSAQGAVSQAPQFDTRTMDTQVLIPNANTLVMGGLMDDNPGETSTKVPILGDIPYLGAAFRSESKLADKKNLLIFITPTILQDTDFHPTTTDFLNAQPQTSKEALNPNSIMDGAKPYNWSDPSNTDPDQKIINQKAAM